jgi:uncharacterized protein (DUF952 family)
MARIYHLILEADWERARLTGQVRPNSLAEEGFIHCSQDEAQMLAVANRLYAGLDGLLTLEVDTGRLSWPVKCEPSRSGEIYPHIYGPLNTDAVVKVQTMSVGADGSFSLGQG